MKKYYFVFFVFFSITSVSSQIINFPDANFKAKLLDSFLGAAQNSNQQYIVIDANADGEIQVSEAQAVYYLNVGNTAISSLVGIEYFINLRELGCGFTHITTLDVSNLTNLTVLSCGYSQISTLNVSGLINLEFLGVSNNFLTSLNLNGLTNIKELYCSNNQLTSLNVNGITSLQELHCGNNFITTLSINNLNNFLELHCEENGMTSLNLSNLASFYYLNCSNNMLTTLNLAGLTNLIYLFCYDNQITSLVNINELVNLGEIDCSNNQITTLNLNNSTDLEVLKCGNNFLNSLDITSLTGLFTLYCNDNQLTTLNVSTAPNLNSLECFNNMLTSLTVTNLPSLYHLYCFNNQLASLDLSGTPNLGQFACGFNNLTSIDFGQLTHVFEMNCSGNHLTTLDLNGLTTLNYITCSNDNELLSVFAKNGRNEICNFSNNPNLQYICVDESQTNTIQNLITSYGYTNCHINSFCTFTPGGQFYTIGGNNRYDYNNNGCDSNDIAYPNLRFSLTSGATTVNLIPDASGSYHYDVQAGTLTIQPIIENPAYFNVSPATATVSFPTATSPFTQNFCITANGIHNNLEVIILPIGRARPGFDANYKIIYKNKGTSTQSGTINLTFNDSILDLISSTPNASNQTVGNLNWNFIGLQPFETREIQLTLNLNSPVESQPVNQGDILNYTATVNGDTDETPNDNVCVFNQHVVNSLDPNDKTCLEGNTISPSMIGEYVHYIIRFENTGTANAQNIVVKDIIDTSKFDINSLVPIDSSHSVVTRISGTNKVEFIFENINLPFDDANNDGYIAFKIKTKSTLVVGNTFSNNASIYFDYNAPIVTNTATTTIQALGTSDFEFENYITLAPNPVSGVLNILTKNTIVISSISIYNTLGQLVLVNTEPTSTLDVSSLKTGNYFVKVNSDKGISTSRFIKE